MDIIRKPSSSSRIFFNFTLLPEEVCEICVLLSFVELEAGNVVVVAL